MPVDKAEKGFHVGVKVSNPIPPACKTDISSSTSIRTTATELVWDKQLGSRGGLG